MIETEGNEAEEEGDIDVADEKRDDEDDVKSMDDDEVDEVEEEGEY